MEGEGDGAREGEVVRLLTLGELVTFSDKVEKEIDLVLPMPFSTLLRPE